MIRALGLLLFPMVVAAAMLYGTVSGLDANKSLVLKSGSNLLVVTTNGPFAIVDGGPISVAIQPSSQKCLVAGTVVTCQTTYTVSGSISGLDTKSLVLRMNSSTLIASGSSYKFSSGLVAGSTYSVAVGIQPAALNCTVSNGMGTVTGNVTANVTCISLRSTVVNWTVPQFNTDGTVLTDLAGYIIYSSTSPTFTTYSSRLVSVPATSSTYSNLLPGVTYYFAIASRNTAGEVGPRSNAAYVTLQ